MARVSGITTQKNTKGEITHVTVNVKKHKEALNALKGLGLVEKTQFELDFENSMTVEELRDNLLKYVKGLPWSKNQ